MLLYTYTTSATRCEMVINDFIIDYFLFEFGWNQLKNIVIKWIFLITAKHTHLFNDRFIPLLLLLDSYSFHFEWFIGYFCRSPESHVRSIQSTQNQTEPNHAFKYTYKMFMFRRFLRSQTSSFRLCDKTGKIDIALSQGQNQEQKIT